MTDPFAQASPVFFSMPGFGQAVTYNGTAITAVFQPDPGQIMAGERTARTGTLWVKASDVAAPAYRDAVVIGSNTWRIIEVPGDDEAGVWRLTVERDERPVV